MEDLEQHLEKSQQQQVIVESFVTATPHDQKLIPRNRIFLDGSYITSPSLSSLRSISSSSSSSSLTTAYITSSSVPNIDLVRSNDHIVGNHNNKDDINCHVQTKRLSRRSFRKFFSFSSSSSSSTSSSSSFVTTLLGLAILTWIGAFLVEFGINDDSRQLRSNRVMKNDTYIQMDEFVDRTKNTPKEDTTISSIFLSLSNFSLGYFEANHVLDLFLQVQRDIYSSMEKIEEVKVGNEDNETTSLEEEGKNVTGSHVEIIVVEDSWQSRNTTTQVFA